MNLFNNTFFRDRFKFYKGPFKDQAGIVFGMDARVTLIVTSIMMMAIGYNQMARLVKTDILETREALEIIKAGVEGYYEDNYSIPTIDELIAKEYINLKENANMDAWGNSYQIGFMAADEVINGVSVNVKYFYVYSYGKNGILDITEPTSFYEFIMLTETGDDLLIKFNTKAQEEKIVKIETEQLAIVKMLLETYVNAKEKTNETFCAVSFNQLDTNCDVDGDGVYDFKEEMGLNYLPKNIDDANGDYYVTINGTHGTENKFKSGYINTTTEFEYNMYTFMDLIGGYSDYVKSPRGLTLHFNSNMYDNNQSPYFAQIWYGSEETVF
ncbi:MAG: hypothetical protein GY793_06025 [Proteobacteria bacterium]|nr:hypothetical protein [Pseudomonadota bacterium]